jgi:hypothetical protein
MALSIAQGHGVYSRIGAGIEGHRGYEQEVQDAQDDQDGNVGNGRVRSFIVEKPTTAQAVRADNSACLICMVEYCAVVNCRSFGGLQAVPSFSFGLSLRVCFAARFVV